MYYCKNIPDNDRFCPAEMTVSCGSHLVYIQATYDAVEVLCCYNRKQALAVAWAIVMATLCSMWKRGHTTKRRHKR